MSLHSYNNISVVTNIVILEFMSAEFVHPGTLPSFYLFFNTS